MSKFHAPWTATLDGHGAFSIEDSDGRQVCFVGVSKEDKARLISAAPAMLELLLQIVGPFEAAKACGIPFGEATIKSDSQMLKKIRAVIAKAEGRS